MTYAFIALIHSFILLCKDNTYTVKQIDARSICKSIVIGNSFIYLYIFFLNILIFQNIDGAMLCIYSHNMILIQQKIHMI